MACSLDFKHVEAALIAGLKRDMESRFHKVGNDVKESFLHMFKERLELTIVSAKNMHYNY